MSKLLTVLLVFVALAGCGYNWLQVQKLQTEIDALKLQVKNRPAAERKYKSEPADNQPAADSDTAVQDQIDGWNRLAALHYANAQKAMSKSDAPLAAQEYTQFMADKRKALALEEQEAVRSINTLRKLAGIKSDDGSLLGSPENSKS